MKGTIAPETAGLSARDRIERISEDHWALILDRKSRIIMADGRRILAKVEKVRSRVPGVRVDVKTRAPVCSKTRAFLQERGIGILDLD